MMPRTRYAWMDSPVGRLLLVADDGGLRRIDFVGGRSFAKPDAEWSHDPVALRCATDQLAEYFAGDRTEFDLPLALRGTAFQLDCWEALRAIPYGQTISYGEQARRLGRPDAARAVGAANGANPISVVVPCHRVVGADGSLVGFGGGLDRKRALIEHEAAATGLFGVVR